MTLLLIYISQKTVSFSNITENLASLCFAIKLFCKKTAHTLSIENHHDFIWAPEIYPPYSFSRACLLEVEIKRFPNFYKYFQGFSKKILLFETNTKIFFCIRKTWTQNWLKLCSSVIVIDFEQVNAPRKAFNVITRWHLNAQSQQQKH